MKTRWSVLFALGAALAAPAFAQFGAVRGICKDKEGKPLAGITVEYHEVGSPRTYKLKTSASGEYSSIAILPGTYNVVLIQNGQELYHLNGIHVSIDEKQVDIDLQHEQAMATKQQGASPGQTQPLTAAQQKELGLVKALDDKLVAANQALAAGDVDSAIKGLTEATDIDPNHTLLWSKLGDVYLDSAPKQTTSDDKTARYVKAADCYQKAIDIKQKELASRPKTADDAADLGHYYNNMAHAQAKSDKVDDAVKSFTQAVQLDPGAVRSVLLQSGGNLNQCRQNRCRRRRLR